MNKPLKFLSFWSINDALDLDALTVQLDELKASGLDGVIFHPRYYPNQPKYMSEAYLDIVSDLILYAKRIGMEFWLYDENGWPSGTAGGEVLARRPELACQWVSYGQRPDGQLGITFHSKPGVSSFQADATALFIEITHEAYRFGLKPEAFEYVTGFFSDEVGFLDGHGVTVHSGGVPWDERFPAMYRQRYGEALEPLLPLLFVDGEGHEQVRTRYWEMITDALVEGFYQPIEAWCETHGKRFTAHLKAEEHPYFQLSFSGSCFQVLQGIETPAIDALERYPGNHFYPRLLHSVAMQQGRDGCLAEAMGGSGWGVTPESFTRYILWLAGHGIDQFVLHLNQFKLKTQAIKDWPPSMPCHLTWKEAFPSLLASIRQKAGELPDLGGEPDVLIVVPTRGIMASFLPEEARRMNIHDGSNVPDSLSGRRNQKLLQLVEACYAAGIHYEFTEERVLEADGKIEPGRLRIGSRRYREVIIAEGCLWETPSLVSRLEAADIQVRDASVWVPNRKRTIADSDRLGEAFSVPEQSAWSAKTPEMNQLWIAFRPGADGTLYAEYAVEGSGGAPLSSKGLKILLHDEVEALFVNDLPLNVRKSKDGRFEALVPEQCLEDKNIRILARALPGGEPCPVAFLSGAFSVISLSPYRDMDDAQWRTEGGFALAPLGQPECSDLIASGFPFAGEAIEVTKSLQLAAACSQDAMLQLTGVHGAAARVRFGDMDLGWCWGPNWSVRLGAQPEGSYALTVALYPSTYNVYGPHTHIDGDRYITSPGQYEGVKNFADREDAPEQTIGTDWHFVKWGIHGAVRLLHGNE